MSDVVRRMYARFRGDWAPGHFDPWVTLSCKLLLYMLMATRGADYLAPESPESMARLALVEAALPLHLWGLALLVAAGAGFLGVAFAVTPMVAGAHVLGGALYLAIGGGTLVTLLLDDPSFDLATWVTTTAILALTIYVSRKLYRCRPDQPRGWLGTFAFGLTAVLCVLAVEVDALRAATLALGIGVLHLLMAAGTLVQDRRRTLLDERGMSV